MTTQTQEFQSHNSPWTEMYALYCQREEMAAATTMADTFAEQQPTRDALADVYNRDDKTAEHHKRFSFNYIAVRED